MVIVNKCEGCDRPFKGSFPRRDNVPTIPRWAGPGSPFCPECFEKGILWAIRQARKEEYENS